MLIPLKTLMKTSVGGGLLVWFWLLRLLPGLLLWWLGGWLLSCLSCCGALLRVCWGTLWVCCISSGLPWSYRLSDGNLYILTCGIVDGCTILFVQEVGTHLGREQIKRAMTSNRTTIRNKKHIALQCKIIIIIIMKTYKAQESVKKPLTALKKRNIKKQRSITIQNKINYHKIYNNRQYCYITPFFSCLITIWRCEALFPPLTFINETLKY